MSTNSGKTALVTGASRGLGRATALRLARDGFTILAHYGRSQDEAAALAAQITASGGKAELLQADLGTAEGVSALAQAVITKLGGKPLDVLVNNAGIAEMVEFADTEVAHIDRQYAVNVRAPFLLTQQLAGQLADDASVVFISSEVATKSFTGAIAYDITKGAINTLVLNLAKLLGERGIRVNGIAPGATATDMAGFLQSEQGAAMAKSIQALKRIGQPEDIADAVAFLAGNDSRWVTGQVLAVSGGWQL